VSEVNKGYLSQISKEIEEKKVEIQGRIISFVLGMCYILCMCVCVGASDTTTASDDPFT
jgi:hypothetical protein